MALATERRRILFRLSLVLNVILIAGPFYAVLKGGSPLPAQLADSSLDRAWKNAIGKPGEVGYDRVPAYHDHGRDHDDDLYGDEEDDVPRREKEVVLAPPPAPIIKEVMVREKQCGICEAGESGKELCDQWG